MFFYQCRKHREKLDMVTLRIVAGVTAILRMFEFSRNIHVYTLKVGLETGCLVSELIKSARRIDETQDIGKLCWCS
jgi:hypothetical protein